ncbi:MAG: peptidylprolyl isomerase [Chitinophagaceae bacterium]
MKKLLLLLSVIYFNVSQSQLLFTYGTKQVTKDEFLKAFYKTPTQDSNRKKALQEYLDLYINFKLKVQAAYDEKLNTDANYKLEAENFKTQLSENEINEEANINQLVQQAFERSKKDIHLLQIFIETPANADTAEAWQQINKAYNDLKNRKNFNEVVAGYSSDATQSDLGYITVFILPYEIENIVYALKPGNFSQPYHSNIGYHIFLNNDERPAEGKRIISQILFAIPPSFNEEEKKAVAKKADSVYQLLQQGANFQQMQQQFSTVSSSDNNTLTFEVNVGEYSYDFEQQVYSLKNPGDISKPFTTAYGYHILQLKKIEPVSSDSNDVSAKAALQEQVQKDNRLAVAKKNLVTKWLRTTSYKPAQYDVNELWKYTDSTLKGKSTKAFKNINKQTILFSFEKQNITVNDWINFVRDLKESENNLATKSYSIIMKEFINTSCSDYYRSHLDEYNKALDEQIKEFNEANLLFAAMDKHVWSNAGQDSVGLKNYYNKHRANYKWAPSVRALIVTASNKQMAKEIADKLKNNFSNWHSIINSYGNAASADSSRFEQDQLPVKNIQFINGFISAPEKNPSDETYNFIYIINVFPQPAQRSFEDAKGMVINDYQQIIEAKWIEELKKKYPVKVNEEVFESIK